MHKAASRLVAVAFALTLAASAVAAEAPAGFVAQAPSPMNWFEAKKFCESNGGRLPQVNKADSLDAPAQGMQVDGFGAIGDKWSPEVPDAAYWTSTTVAGESRSAYGVNTKRGAVNAYSSKQGGQNRVLCVAK